MINTSEYTFFIIISVKPVIRMEHDSDSDESLVATGVLGGSEGEKDDVEEEDSGDEDSQANAQDSSKMSSGDGPSATKHKKSTFKVPAKKNRSDGKTVTSTDGATPSTSQGHKTTSTQASTVCNKRNGYSTYPAYLYDVPPLQLNIESLRRQFLIAKIEAAKKQSNFYDNAINFMGFVKESVRTMAEVNGLKLSKANGEGEHAYAMSQDLFNADDNANDK